jgi:hypothetical protein
MMADRTLQHLDLALCVTPLLAILKGDKRERLHRAFVASAEQLGLQLMPELEGRLPVNARDAALELHRSVIDLCLRIGVNGRELADHYNDVREAASFGNGGVGEACERGLALLAILHARKLMEPQQ